MTHRRPLTARPFLMESLEERALFSTSYAVMVMDSPRSAPVQLEADPSHSAAASPTASLASALDIQVRQLAGGIYLTVAASSLTLADPAPTGTVDFYADQQFLGSVALGGTFCSALVLDAGQHTFSAFYNGDDLFLPSQTSATTLLTAPTNTQPADPTTDMIYPTNDAGERIRPMRFLSRVNFFDSQGLSVAQLPAAPGTGGKGSSGGPTMPNPRFSKVSFSLNPRNLTHPVSSNILHVMSFGIHSFHLT